MYILCPTRNLALSFHLPYMYTVSPTQSLAPSFLLPYMYTVSPTQSLALSFHLPYNVHCLSYTEPRSIFSSPLLCTLSLLHRASLYLFVSLIMYTVSPTQSLAPSFRLPYYVHCLSYTEPRSIFSSSLYNYVHCLSYTEPRSIFSFPLYIHCLSYAEPQSVVSSPLYVNCLSHTEPPSIIPSP